MPINMPKHEKPKYEKGWFSSIIIFNFPEYVVEQFKAPEGYIPPEGYQDDYRIYLKESKELSDQSAWEKKDGSKPIFT